jgi:OmpA-OmpF porin, OOP family
MSLPAKEPAMRTNLLLAASVIFAASALSPITSSAQGSPSAEQIVKSLMPTGTSGPTRGIRIAPSAPTPDHVQEKPPSAPSVSLNVQFALGSAELTPQAVHVLDNLGKALTDRSLSTYRFRIEGHTDTLGTRDYNKELSDRRAAAVVDYLANNFHVERSRVEAIGLGVDGLLIPTPDQTPEPRNRRVQVVNIGS